MKKTLRAFAAISALALLFGFASCQTDDEEPESKPSTPVTPEEPSDDEKYSTKLVNFNGNNTVWNAEINGFCMDESDLGNIENYMVYNHKVDLENDTIVLKATVNFSTISGHTGVGFISVDGLKRKGYQLLTGQNIKNVGCSEGGSGQGFDSKVDGFSWTLNKDYIFEVTLSQNTMSYVVKDETGELASKLNTTVYHNKNDIVYPAFGGTSRKSATYKNISVTLNGKEIAIDGLDPQSQLPTLSLDKTTVRINSTTTGTVVATATYEGNVVPVKVTSSDTNAVTVSVGEDGKTITVTPVAQTSGTTVTVKHSKADYISATFEVVVADFNETDSYGALNVYPANAETAAYEDSTLRLTFDENPTLSAGGFVSIYDGDGTLVDTITMSEEKQNTLAGLTVKVKSQLVRVEDKNLLITPHFGKLESGKTYYVAIPQGVITGKLNGIKFTGLTNVATASSWKFTTRQAPTISSEITVNSAEDSTADFRSLNGALKAIGTSSTSEYTINLAKGTYYELINTKIAGNVKIVGETTNPDETVIKYINHNEWNGSTNIRPSFYVGGTGNLILKNVTIQNATRRGVDTNAPESQAEAIYFQSTGNLAAYNCNFKSYQDTIQVGNKGGKAWFYKCYIEGDVDFIWGTADVALFEECKLKALNDEARTTKTEDLLVARTYLTNGKIAKGFVVLNSEFEIVDGITAGFGRCAGSGDFYDQCAVVNTKVTGTLTDFWWTEKSYTPLAGHETHVGWKDYNITGANGTVLTPTSRCPNTSSMAETLYEKEYNGRRAILNRVYKVEDAAYVAGSGISEEILSALETEFNASTDESINNVYEEEASNTWIVPFTADGTYTDGKLTVSVSGTNTNNHGVEVKSDNSSVITISIPAGSYVLAAGDCKYGKADTPYVLTCDNSDFTQEYIGAHTYTTEDCYNPGSGRTALYGDYYFVKSASDMVITLNSASGVKEYLPFIMVVKEPKYFTPFTADGTYTNGDMTVSVSGTNTNNHGVEVKSDNSSVITISIPAGSYVLAAGDCKYGKADTPYVLTCDNSDFTQEYIGAHTYTVEDCYNPGSGRTALYGDYYFVKSASDMVITLNSASGVKEYLPFIGVIK